MDDEPEVTQDEIPETDTDTDVDGEADAEISDYTDDDDDPDALKKSLSAKEDALKKLEKRRRDVQSYASKKENEARRAREALEKAGLELTDDGEIRRKPVDVEKKNDFDEKKFNEMAAKDPAGAIQKLIDAKVDAKVDAKLNAEKAKSVQVSLRKSQAADRRLYESLPGAEDVKEQIFDIIKEEGLEFARNPFSAAVQLSGDQQLIEALSAKKRKGRTRGSDKGAATVATGGGRTSDTLVAGKSYEDLMRMPMEKIEKLAEAETRKQRGLR